MDNKELIESLEKVVKELKERQEEGLKSCKNPYNHCKWNRIADLNLKDIQYSTCLFSVTDDPVSCGRGSSVFTIGFIDMADTEKPIEDIEIKTNRFTVKDRIEKYREKLSDYTFVIKLNDLKF